MYHDVKIDTAISFIQVISRVSWNLPDFRRTFLIVMIYNFF